MRKRILNYRRQIDRLLEEEKTVDWKCILEEHLQQIQFFQHERCMHLIVTVTFALLEMLAICMFLLSGSLAIGILTLLLLILLVPYIRHYYLLENEVQKMYVQYDTIWERMHKHT